MTPVKLGGKLRGHAISCTADGVWRYDDTGQIVSQCPYRDCGHCGEASTAEGHDACLGTLPGVLNACCGHGVDREAYVVLADGVRLAGSIALEWMNDHRTRD